MKIIRAAAACLLTITIAAPALAQQPPPEPETAYLAPFPVDARIATNIFTLEPQQAANYKVQIEMDGTDGATQYVLQTPVPQPVMNPMTNSALLWIWKQTGGGENWFTFQAVNTIWEERSVTVTVNCTWAPVQGTGIGVGSGEAPDLIHGKAEGIANHQWGQIVATSDIAIEGAPDYLCINETIILKSWLVTDGFPFENPMPIVTDWKVDPIGENGGDGQFDPTTGHEVLFTPTAPGRVRVTATESQYGVNSGTVEFIIYEVQSITAIPKGWPQGEPLPETISIGAGAINSPAHQADIKIQVFPELAGIPIFVELLDGLGREAGKTAKLLIGSTTLVGEGAGATFATSANGVIEGVLTSSDVINDCTIQACQETRCVNFTWDEFIEEDEWTFDPMVLPIPGVLTNYLRLHHHRLGENADEPRQPLDQHRIRFFVEKVVYWEDGELVTKLNTPNNPSNLSAWASFPEEPYTTDANGLATALLTVPPEATNLVSVTMVAYDWGVYLEPAVQAQPMGSMLLSLLPMNTEPQDGRNEVVGSKDRDRERATATLDIFRLEGDKVEGNARKAGSITRILNPNLGETAGGGRDAGVSLKLEPSVENPGGLTLNYKLRLRTISNERNRGHVRVYRRAGATDTLILDNTPGASLTEANITQAQLNDEFWMEFERGGIIEIEFVALDGTIECSSSYARATGIACKPKDGKIYFVNPDGVPGFTPIDFVDQCSPNLTTMLGYAVPANANIIVAGATYNENGLTVPNGVMIAGLGAAFDNAEPHDFLFDDVPVIDAGLADGIFALNARQGNHFSGMALQHGKQQKGGAISAENSSDLTVAYARFTENRADDFGGALYLKTTSDAIVSGCKFNLNRADHDAGAAVRHDVGMGGAIATIESMLTVTNCLFQGNFAQVRNGLSWPNEGSAGGGGDIYQNKGELYFLDSRSENAIAGFPVDEEALAPGNGEAGYFTGDGGSILIHGGKNDTELEIRDSIFVNSQSFGNGGCISISKNSSPDGRGYFDVAFNLFSPPVLGGGCVGLMSNVVFSQSKGGWHGGAISANGRYIMLDIVDSEFTECRAGTTHLRDGKAGAVSVGGGFQSPFAPKNNVRIARCRATGCTASGNGGSFYVTIRGRLILEDVEIAGSAALNSGQGQPDPEDDYRLTQGMGGGIHASAGGYVYIKSGTGTGFIMQNCNAAVSGGGLSVKSGKAYFDGDVIIDNNRANGSGAGYGNGGGVFVTTSFHDSDVGQNAALLFMDNGFVSSTSSGVEISNNIANGWGGGIYAGISAPWLSPNWCPARVSLENAHVEHNAATRSAQYSPFLKPSQIAAQRVRAQGYVLPSPYYNVSGTAIDGDASDIGIYELDSISVSRVGTTYGAIPTAQQVITE